MVVQCYYLNKVFQVSNPTTSRSASSSSRWSRCKIIRSEVFKELLSGSNSTTRCLRYEPSAAHDDGANEDQESRKLQVASGGKIVIASNQATDKWISAAGNETEKKRDKENRRTASNDDGHEQQQQLEAMPTAESHDHKADGEMTQQKHKEEEKDTTEKKKKTTSQILPTSETQQLPAPIEHYQLANDRHNRNHHHHQSQLHRHHSHKKHISRVLISHTLASAVFCLSLLLAISVGGDIDQQPGRRGSCVVVEAAAANRPPPPSASGAGGPMQSPIDWPRVGRQLFDYRRWANTPNNHDTRDSYRYPRQGYVRRTLNRIRTQIGARNTIRVHNAFRDFAWRLLSGLSMPTPVIYELRRQNFYPPDEDLMNDSLHNKNTTRTIRTRRLLAGLWPAGAKKSLPIVQLGASPTAAAPSGSASATSGGGGGDTNTNNRNRNHNDRAKHDRIWIVADELASRWLKSMGRQSLAPTGAISKRGRVSSSSSPQSRHKRAMDSEDDDEPENLRERLRMRLDDLISLSRRSLFGRVVRLPAIFPFKRNQETNDGQHDADGGPLDADKHNATHLANGRRKRRRHGLISRQESRQQSAPGSSRRRSRRSRSKKRDNDRQMISINGKQYYVDDEGELKELKGDGGRGDANDNS